MITVFKRFCATIGVPLLAAALSGCGSPESSNIILYVPVEDNMAMGDVTTGASSVSFGGFTITPVWGTTPAPCLTDDLGKTYYYVPGTTGSGPVATGVPTDRKVITTTLKLSVKYDETRTNAEEINRAWQAAATAITVNISDVSEGVPSGGGIKFYEAATPADWGTYATSVSLTWSVDELKALVFAWNSIAISGSKCIAQETSTKNVYYGIKGVGGTTADASAIYKMQADIVG